MDEFIEHSLRIPKAQQDLLDLKWLQARKHQIECAQPTDYSSFELINPELPSKYQTQECMKLGIQHLGHCAVITVAGGQGTRLGFKHAKGLYPLFSYPSLRSPKFTLLGMLAGQISRTQRQYSCHIPWLIMVSEATEHDIARFIEDNDGFGLEVHLFKQGSVPVMSESLRVCVSEGSLTVSPDGHGGMVQALKRSGLLSNLRARGITTFTYSHVDNPLAYVLDLHFIGRHIQSQAGITAKVVPKRDAAEGLGHIGTVGGVTRTVEYSDLPGSLATARKGDGSLQLWCGSIGIYCFDASLLDGVEQLPWHIARKPVRDGGEMRPGYKMEQFVFDVMPLAPVTCVLLAGREEFSPVKRAVGSDTPLTSEKAYLDRCSSLYGPSDRVLFVSPWLTASEVSGMPPRIVDGINMIL
eukprot:gnl/Dysnectes_brevis/1746_a1992_1287.p1 GENE.gnl/Dysnectes_brevis/1746_a1992_1287~~gnl/Dysnectes_brevis/1746_a1992_1287.p1  ORF type:complete len:411 (+),score=74.70 gnl/Dysnectes_brevis/1746_a1992_1287:104-1336(+)